MMNKLILRIWRMSNYLLNGTFIMLLLATTAMASSVQQERDLKQVIVTVEFSEDDIFSVLHKLEKISDFRFAFNRSDLRKAEKVTGDFRNKSLYEILSQVSNQANVKFRQVNSSINVSLKERQDATEEMIQIIQTRTVTGTVTSLEDEEGIPGVNVLVKGTQRGTVTNVMGEYSIEVSSGETLVFSAVGYTTEEIAVGNQSVIDLAMVADIQQLSEIVVIGYGEREKKDLTGAISVVESEELNKTNAIAPELAMQGRMAGVFVSTPSGDPTDRPTVRIRGVGTLNVNDPLYVIDGVPVAEWGAGIEGGGRNNTLRGNVNILNMINPNDIASISVLKDASAAAIYGVRAANGVVLITTKKGQKGAPRVSVSSKISTQRIPNTYNLLGVQDYNSIYLEAAGNNIQDWQTVPREFLPGHPLYLGNLPTVERQSLRFRDNALLTDNSVQVSGGTESTNYFVSAGYAYNESVAINDNIERYSLALNVDTKISKWLKTGLVNRLSYATTVNNNAGNLGNAVSGPPWQPFLDPDGPLGYATTFDSLLTLNDNFEPGGSVPIYDVQYGRNESGVFWDTPKFGPETEGNNLAGTAYDASGQQIVRNLGTAFVEVEPIEGLKLKGSVSMDWTLNQNDSWGLVVEELFRTTPGNPFAAGARDGTTTGGVGRRVTKNWNIVKEFTIDYVKSFGDHNFNLTLNAMDQYFQFDAQSTSSDQNPFDLRDPRFRFVIENRDFVSGFTERNNWALQGYMARLSYNYASKYYLDATVRRDGSSRFAPEFRWGIFPGFSAAWRISSEDFMQDIPFINDLKIRGGWGELGNQEVQPFRFLSTVNQLAAYSFGSGNGDPIGTSNGVQAVQLPDFPIADLSWETTRTVNFGFDGVFLNNTLNLTAEYYRRKTVDILQESRLPESVGNRNDPTLNLAEVLNTGFEFVAGYNNTIGDFEYGVSANFTTVNNEVLEIFNDQPFGGQGGRIEEGFPINYLWGFKTGGIFQDQDEIDQYQETFNDQQANSTLVRPGDFYFQDVHGNPTEDEPFYSQTPDSLVNLNDRTFIGNTIPGHFYGINLTAGWKGFDASIFFQGVGDVQRRNGGLQQRVAMSSLGNSQSTYVRNRWTPDQPNTWDPSDPANSLPRAVLGDPAGNNRFSDRMVQDAGFMRLRNLEIGYTLPQSLMNRLGFIQNFRIYAGGSNLFVLTKWVGNDPENDNLPIPRVFTLGLNANF